MSFERIRVFQISGSSLGPETDVPLFEAADCRIYLTRDPELAGVVNQVGDVLLFALTQSAPSPRSEPQEGAYLIYRESVALPRSTEDKEGYDFKCRIAYDEVKPARYTGQLEVALGALAMRLDVDDTRIAEVGRATVNLDGEKPCFLFVMSGGSAELFQPRPIEPTDATQIAQTTTALLRSEFELPSRLLGAADASSDDPVVRFALAWGAIETLIQARYQAAYRAGIDQGADERFCLLRSIIQDAFDNAQAKEADLPLLAKLRVMLADTAPSLADELVTEFRSLKDLRDRAFHRGRVADLPSNERRLRRCVRRLFAALLPAS